MSDIPAVPPPRIVALVSDLMFSSKITASARAQQIAVKIVRNPQALSGAIAAGGIDHAIIDLNASAGDPIAAIEALKRDGPTIRITAFASHVDSERIAAARHAGADHVLARSAFSSNIDAILRS